MTVEEALDLIRAGIGPGRMWADLGAGTGTFTRALGELLGPDATIYAVDRSDRAVRALQELEIPEGTTLHVRRADVKEPLKFPALDGVLMANALHFVRDQTAALQRIAAYLRPGGRLLLVEYDRARGNRWVPYPVPPERFRALAEEAGLTAPREVGRRRSTYGREMYAAVARRPDRALRSQQ